jgi:hypothetical protein
MIIYDDVTLLAAAEQACSAHFQLVHFQRGGWGSCPGGATVDELHAAGGPLKTSTTSS